MRDISLFVTPYSASDEGGAAEGAGGMLDAAGLDALLDQMGNGASGENTGNTDADNPPAENKQENADPPAEGDGNGSENKPSKEDQRNFAFGQMRTEIKSLEGLLEKVAKANGIEFTDAKDLKTKLTDDAIRKMAEKDHVPVELLQKLEALEADSNELKRQRLQDAAAVGFQKVMDTYGLTTDQLKEFAVELEKQGKNPFTQAIDIVAEYKMLHYDDILKAEVQKAVEAALKKDSAANESSTQPGQQQGSNGGSGDKISTVAALDALLDGMPK